jgi:hypothetical protein
MYVRWKRRVRDGHVAYAAQIVASSRTGGQPRQRIVAYLGFISEGWRADRGLGGLWTRQQFWRGVDARLGEVAVPEPERERLAAAVAASVPRLTAEEEAALEQQWQRLAGLEQAI